MEAEIFLIFYLPLMGDIIFLFIIILAMEGEHFTRQHS